MTDHPQRRRGQARRAGRRARPLVNILLGAAALVALMGVGAAVFVVWGVYNVSALQQHTPLVYGTIGVALERSISRHAEGVAVPALDDPALLEEGLRHYRTHCVQCHGAPGVGRAAVGRAMTPVPANLVQTGRTRSAAEIFWTVKHGIKMSGMPAWEFALSDAEIWSLVALIRRLPYLSPAEYRAMDARLAAGQGPPGAQPGGPPDPERGRRALQGYACTSCHTIPGVVGPPAEVGPPLEGMAKRRFIAGVLPNTFDNMVRWIRQPVGVDPLTAMPDLDVREQDARDIAAFLYTLE